MQQETVLEAVDKGQVFIEDSERFWMSMRGCIILEKERRYHGYVFNNRF